MGTRSSKRQIGATTARGGRAAAAMESALQERLRHAEDVRLTLRDTEHARAREQAIWAEARQTWADEKAAWESAWTSLATDEWSSCGGSRWWLS